MAAQLDRPPGDAHRRRGGAPDEEEFAYAALVNRWRRERATTTLTKMDDGFYAAFDQHLRRLHEDYQREQAANPATPKVLILLDELTNLQRVRQDLYDLREKKIVTAAMIAARDGRPDRNHMTREEDALFDGVLRVLTEGRRAALRTAAPEPPKAPGGPPTPPEPVAAPASAAQPASLLPPPEPAPEAPLAPVAAEAPRAPPAERVAGDEADARADEPAPGKPVGAPRVLVRVKERVEPFVAPDLRHYRLMPEDVAALPRDVAHLLVQRGLATALSG